MAETWNDNIETTHTNTFERYESFMQRLSFMTAESSKDRYNNEKALLSEQLRYYRERAGEYDEWFLRNGRYNHGSKENTRWFREIRFLEKKLDEFGPGGRILEIACGTGFWTQKLLQYSDDITALDASEEVIILNREKCKPHQPDYIVADIFSWKPIESYDVVFFSFWLSHVPPGLFADFWKLVRGCLAERGRVFFIDSSSSQKHYTRVHKLPRPSRNEYIVGRRLNSGRTFRIIKVRFEPEVLAERLGELGWNISVLKTQEYFIFGNGNPM